MLGRRGVTALVALVLVAAASSVSANPFNRLFPAGIPSLAGIEEAMTVIPEKPRPLPANAYRGTYVSWRSQDCDGKGGWGGCVGLLRDESDGRQQQPPQ